MFQVHLVLGLLLLLGVSSQKDADEGRPYEFSFTIDGEQHRYEKKDVNGIIQGEFGFITGDGVYHVTVYATDENGSFKILSMKNVKISEPLDQGGKRIADVPLPQGIAKTGPAAPASSAPAPPPPSGPAPPAPPAAGQPGPPAPTTPRSLTYDFTTATTHRHGCSGCGIVPTPPTGPLKFQNPTFKNQDNGGGKQPPTNDGPPGLVQKQFSATAQPTFNNPSTVEPKFEEPLAPRIDLLAPGTNPAPQGSETPTEQNPFGPPAPPPPPSGLPQPQKPVPPQVPQPNLPQPPEPTQNQIPSSPKTAIAEVKVDKGVIMVPGNDPIPIQDKYPNMVDGLPDGITEKDVTDLLYKFNYTVGFHGHYEKGLKNGAKVGGYFVNGRDGISRVVTYIADENGYRPKFTLINLGLESEDTPKPDTEKTFGLKNFEFVWYPVK